MSNQDELAHCFEGGSSGLTERFLEDALRLSPLFDGVPPIARRFSPADIRGRSIDELFRDIPDGVRYGRVISQHRTCAQPSREELQRHKWKDLPARTSSDEVLLPSGAGIYEPLCVPRPSV